MSTAIRAGYKQTEVGVIPQDWSVVKFGGLIEYTKGFPFKSSEYSINGVRVIRVSDTSYDAILNTNPIYVAEHSAPKYAKWSLRNADLLISTVGSKPPMYDSMVGKVVLVTTEHEGALLNQNSVVVRDKQRRPFLQQILLGHFRTKRYLNWIETILRGNANQASITLKDLFDFRIPIADLDVEQRAIAIALSDVDALLAKLDEFIAKKRDLKQAAMQQLLTGQTRLPGFSGEWEVKRLGDVAEIVMGQSPSSVNYNAKGLGLPLIQGNADIADRKTIRRIFTTEITKRGKCGDILMSVRAPVGEISRAGFDVCLGRGVCAIRYKSDFMYHYLISLEPSWARLSKGSTFDSVNSTDVKALEVCLPLEEAEQRAIATVLTDMDIELTALEARRDKTRALKQGMMQELLTGCIRLV